MMFGERFGRLLRRPRTWFVGLPIVVVLSLFGGAFVYTHLLQPDPPKPMSFADIGMGPTVTNGAGSGTGSGSGSGSGSASGDATTTTATTLAASTSTTVAGRAVEASTTVATVAGSEVDGRWSAGHGSQARYDIKDTVFGMTTTVVGSTSDVSGTVAIANGSVSAAKVVVNMQTVSCDCMHDSKYHEMLETDTYPTSTFELTRAIPLASIPADGQVVNIPVAGNFTIHAVTHAVTFTLAAVRQAGRIAVNAKIPVKLEDYKISGGSNAAGSVHDPFIEFLVAFDRA